MKLEEIKPGVRVFAHVGPDHKIYGTLGNAWGEEGPQPIVKFDNGLVSWITESNVGQLHIDPPN